MAEFNNLILIENGEEYFVKSANDVEEIVIPNEYNGKPVTKIGEWAFSGLDNLKKITIPNSVKEYGGNAFAGCNALEQILISESVEKVGCTAFAGCASLTIYCKAPSVPTTWHQWWNTWNCPVYCYKETAPDKYGFYWHYDENGDIKKWK